MTAAGTLALGERTSGPAALAMLLAGTLAAALAARSGQGLALLGLALALPLAALVPSRPWLGLMLLLASAWANLSEVMATQHGLPSLDRILLPGLGVLAVARWWLFGERPGGDRFIVLALAMIAATMLATLLHADDPDLVLGAVSLFARDALLILVVIALIRVPLDLHRAVWAVLAGGGLIAAASVGRLVAHDLVGDAGGLARALVLHIAGELDDLRLVGPLDDPNSFAQILVPLLPLAWSRAVHARSWGLRAAAAVIGVLVATVVVATYSRSALLVAGFAVGLCWLAWHRHRLLLPTLAAVGAVAALPWLPPSYTDRVAELGGVVTGDTVSLDRALSGRLDEMTLAVRMFQDHPLTGVGVRHYPTQFERYASSERFRPRGEPRNAHSLPLEIAAERGVFGLGVLAGVLGFIALRIGHVRAVLRRREGGIVEARLAESIGLALVTYGTMSLSLHENYSHYMWLLVALALATPALLHRQRATSNVTTPAHFGPLLEIDRC